VSNCAIDDEMSLGVGNCIGNSQGKKRNGRRSRWPNIGGTARRRADQVWIKWGRRLEQAREQTSNRLNDAICGMKRVTGKPKEPSLGSTSIGRVRMPSLNRL
jgi:hypothetical protein